VIWSYRNARRAGTRRLAALRYAVVDLVVYLWARFTPALRWR
jgi:hypothetical protein